MREKFDFGMVRILLKKEWTGSLGAIRRRDFSRGVLLRTLLAAAFLVVFVLFFARFSASYATIPTNNTVDPAARLYEILSVGFTLLLLFLTMNGITGIHREIFASDDLRLYSAMPIGVRSLYIAKLIVIYVRQAIAFLPVLLAVTLTAGISVGVSPWFYVSIFFIWLLMPLVSLALSSVLALPYYALRRLLKENFVLSFILVTLLLALLFAVYAFVLHAVEDILLGEDFRFFFNAALMKGIATAVSFLVPAKWIAGLMLGINVLENVIATVLLLFTALALSFVVLRAIFTRTLGARFSGGSRFVSKSCDPAPRRSEFSALIRKEFVQVFRTHSYMFSYFSVAVVMPLMVYFCLSLGASLISRLAGLDCDLELALFLTLLFGALTNVFCTTNISREGGMLYCQKAMPINWKTLFFAKIFFCMIVTTVSQFATAVLVCATGYVPWYFAIFLFFAGTLFGFAYICVATRSDFNRPHFSTEEDGEIGESGATGTIVIFFGILFSLLVGGGVVLVRVLSLLRGADLSYLTYVIAGAVTLLAAGLGALYLVRGLGKKYRNFEEENYR